jgi:hypothetical protein
VLTLVLICFSTCGTATSGDTVGTQTGISMVAAAGDGAAGVIMVATGKLTANSPAIGDRPLQVCTELAWLISVPADGTGRDIL